MSKLVAHTCCCQGFHGWTTNYPFFTASTSPWGSLGFHGTVNGSGRERVKVGMGGCLRLVVTVKKGIDRRKCCWTKLLTVATPVYVTRSQTGGKGHLEVLGSGGWN